MGFVMPRKDYNKLIKSLLGMRLFFAFLLAFFVGVLLFLFRLVFEEFFGAGFAVFRLPFVTLTRSQSEADHCQNKERMFHRARWIRDLSEKGNPSFLMETN